MEREEGGKPKKMKKILCVKCIIGEHDSKHSPVRYFSMILEL
jgi:hypothetical protein